MADGVVIGFPAPGAAQRAAEAVEAAREAHLAAYAEWLRVARPTRDDAELEAEVFTTTARQLAQRHARPPGT